MILGIDPWIRKLWYALIQPDWLKIIEAGILQMDVKKTEREDQYQRMLEIQWFFTEIFDKYDIKKLAMERYFFTKFNLGNAEFVYGMRWIVLALALKKWIEISEYTPLEIKKRITGNSKASKELMQQFTMKLYKLKDIPEYHDAADALWLAYIESKK